MKDEKLEQIKESLAQLQSQFKTVIADMDMTEENKEDKYMKHMSNMANYFYQMIDGVRSYLYRLEEQAYTHANKGHLPSLNPGQMNKMLEMLDMDDSYEASKHQVSCASHNNYIIEAEIPNLK